MATYPRPESAEGRHVARCGTFAATNGALVRGLRGSSEPTKTCRALRSPSRKFGGRDSLENPSHRASTTIRIAQRAPRSRPADLSPLEKPRSCRARRALRQTRRRARRLNSRLPRPNVRPLPDSAVLPRRSNQQKPIPILRFCLANQKPRSSLPSSRCSQENAGIKK
jgi:hypothetical protein